MGTNLSKYLAGIVSLIIFGGVLFGAGYFSGGKSRDAEYAANAAEVGQAMARLGLVIQKQSSKTAEATRGRQTAEKRRIDAINTKQHQSKKIKQLEAMLAQVVREQSAKQADAGNLQNTDNGRYHVFDAAIIERVWNRASGNDLSTSGFTRAVQTRPGQITLGTASVRWFSG